MRTLGICTSRRTVEELDYEKRRLYEAGLLFYDSVLLIDTRAVSYQFIRGEKKPKVVHQGKDITALSSLHVRSTRGREASTAILVRTLKLCGCDVLDPIDRFSVGYASKLLSTLERFQEDTGSDSFLAFNRQSVDFLLDDLQQKGRFPLIAKPIAGKKGQGIQAINDIDAAVAYVDRFFERRLSDDVPLFLQDFVEFVAEYRVLVVDGEAIGAVRKIKREGELVANAESGATFVAACVPHVIEFTLQNVSQDGVLGADVAVDSSGILHLIEANRAPMWQAFEQATGIDVAEAIMKRSVRRLTYSPHFSSGIENRVDLPDEQTEAILS